MATYFSYDLAVNVNSSASSYAYTNTTGKHVLLTVNMNASAALGASFNHAGTATTSGGSGGVSRAYVVYTGHESSIITQRVGGSTAILLIPGQTLTLQHTLNVDVSNVYTTQLTGFSISN